VVVAFISKTIVHLIAYRLYYRFLVRLELIFKVGIILLLGLLDASPPFVNTA